MCHREAHLCHKEPPIFRPQAQAERHIRRCVPIGSHGHVGSPYTAGCCHHQCQYNSGYSQTQHHARLATALCAPCRQQEGVRHGSKCDTATTNVLPASSPSTAGRFPCSPAPSTTQHSQPTLPTAFLRPVPLFQCVQVTQPGVGDEHLRVESGDPDHQPDLRSENHRIIRRSHSGMQRSFHLGEH